MLLISPRAMFERAYKACCAIGAFNVNNSGNGLGNHGGRNSEERPLPILQVLPEPANMGQNYIVKLIEAGLLEADLFRLCSTGPRRGFRRFARPAWTAASTSVMIDGSQLPFKENIAVTKRVGIRPCPRRSGGSRTGPPCRVEGKIGLFRAASLYRSRLGRGVCGAFRLRPPAIAIGTSHGAYSLGAGEAKLDFERLEKIGNLMPVTRSSCTASSVNAGNLWKCAIPTAEGCCMAGVLEELLRKASPVWPSAKSTSIADIRLAMTASIRKQLVEHP